MKRKNKNNKLLVSISKYYITFILICLVIFVCAYLLLCYSVGRTKKNNNIPIYNFMNSNIDDFNNINYRDITSIGGSIEVLDSSKNVIDVIGAGVSNKTKYTEDELLSVVSMNNSDSKYSVFINRCMKDGKKVTVLIWIPRNKLSFEFKLTRVPYHVVGKHVYKDYLIVIISGAFLGIVGIIIYSLWTAKKIQRPLRAIDNALVQVSNGNYDYKIDIDDDEEFVVVCNTINYLTEKLRISEEENKRLTESKNRMLMDLSHDIKTPITTIKGFSQALYGGLIVEEDKKERYYKTIYNKSERVSELVDDLFEFVKFENNNYKVNFEEIDLAEYLRQIIVLFVDELEEKSFNLDINIPEDQVMFKTDTKLFKRLINNLVENAIKYNDKGTTLRVDLRDIGKYIVIEVADNGVGIDEKVRDKIFDAFVRGDESRKSDGGSGLGLSISKKIVQNLGGEITLLPPSSKEKTIFYIKLNRS